MPIQLLVLLLALVVEDQHLVATALLDDLCGDESLRRFRELALFAADRQHFVKLDVVAAGLRQLLDFDHVPGCDAILFSPGADDRVHGNASHGPQDWPDSLARLARRAGACGPELFALASPQPESAFSRAEWPALFPEAPDATPAGRWPSEPRVRGALKGCCYRQTIEV